MSRQVEWNSALWLTTQGAKIGLSCPLGISHWQWVILSHKKIVFLYHMKISFIDKACSLKVARYWLKECKNKTYPATLTSCSVNSPYWTDKRILLKFVPNVPKERNRPCFELKKLQPNLKIMLLSVTSIWEETFCLTCFIIKLNLVHNQRRYTQCTMFKWINGDF